MVIKPVAILRNWTHNYHVFFKTRDDHVIISIDGHDVEKIYCEEKDDAYYNAKDYAWKLRDDPQLCLEKYPEIFIQEL